MKNILRITLILSTLFSSTPVLSQTATYYSNYYNGRKMANGQRFYQNSNTVASNNYKLGTRLKICYKGRCVIGVVKDRCKCSIDLSKTLFRQLAPLKKGRIQVKIKRLN